MPGRMPFALLLAAAVMLFAAGIFSGNKEFIDIQLSDTMFVITRRHFLGGLSFFVFLLWLISNATRKIVFSNKLSWFYVVIILILLLILLAAVFFRWESVITPLHLYRPDKDPVFYSINHPAIVLYCLAALVLVQLVFVLNLLTGWYKRSIR